MSRLEEAKNRLEAALVAFNQSLFNEPSLLRRRRRADVLNAYNAYISIMQDERERAEADAARGQFEFLYKV